MITTKDSVRLLYDDQWLPWQRGKGKIPTLLGKNAVFGTPCTYTDTYVDHPYLQCRSVGRLVRYTPMLLSEHLSLSIHSKWFPALVIKYSHCLTHHSHYRHRLPFVIVICILTERG